MFSFVRLLSLAYRNIIYCNCSFPLSTGGAKEQGSLGLGAVWETEVTDAVLVSADFSTAKLVGNDLDPSNNFMCRKYRVAQPAIW